MIICPSRLTNFVHTKILPNGNTAKLIKNGEKYLLQIFEGNTDKIILESSSRSAKEKVGNKNIITKVRNLWKQGQDISTKTTDRVYSQSGDFLGGRTVKDSRMSQKLKKIFTPEHESEIRYDIYGKRRSKYTNVGEDRKNAFYGSWHISFNELGLPLPCTEKLAELGNLSLASLKEMRLRLQTKFPAEKYFSFNEHTNYLRSIDEPVENVTNTSKIWNLLS